MHSQQLVRVGGRDGISSRAEMQQGFPTTEVRHKDMHVSAVSSLTRRCKVSSQKARNPVDAIVVVVFVQTRNFSITTLSPKQDEPRRRYAGGHLQGRAARHLGRPGPDRLVMDGASGEALRIAWPIILHQDGWVGLGSVAPALTTAKTRGSTQITTKAQVPPEQPRSIKRRHAQSSPVASCSI